MELDRLWAHRQRRPHLNKKIKRKCQNVKRKKYRRHDVVECYPGFCMVHIRDHNHPDFGCPVFAFRIVFRLGASLEQFDLYQSRVYHDLCCDPPNCAFARDV